MRGISKYFTYVIVVKLLLPISLNHQVHKFYSSKLPTVDKFSPLEQGEVLEFPQNEFSKTHGLIKEIA